jgi:septal ring factor EnvC (AmiA/AmiB activator)
MPQIPAELVPILAQFPVVALVFVAAWVMLKWADRRAAEELAREKARSETAAQQVAAEIERLERDLQQARADRKAAEERMLKWLEDELTRLRSRNTELQKQLDANRGVRTPGES